MPYKKSPSTFASKLKYMKQLIASSLLVSVALFSCKREGCTDPKATNYDEQAKKDNGSCVFGDTSNPSTYTIPTTYQFEDAAGNSTVDYSGQTDRLNQFNELMDYVKLAKTQTIDAQVLHDMWANTNGDGNGNFSFSSSKQLKDKCFAVDEATIAAMFDSLALVSQSFGNTASSGQAGTLTSGTSVYLLDKNGYEHKELIEKAIMGGVIMYQSLNVYFGDSKMNVDNTTAVDPSNGKYYTAMAHHFDEAFGYFGVPVDFPTTAAFSQWGGYCNGVDATIGSNSRMMNNFLKGRAAIANNVMTDRDAAIYQIRRTWEEISAYQALRYIDLATGFFGNDQAKFMHVMSEVYGFCFNLRYAPEATRRMNNVEHAGLMSLFKENMWDMTLQDINAIKLAIQAKF